MPYTSGDILLDKYRIEGDALGQGAFGDVYLVTHIALKEPRAIKVLRRNAPGTGSNIYKETQQRFQLEAQLGARLHRPIPNPHLLQVYDLILRDDLLLLEMEYAAGGSLAERIQKQKDSNLPFTLEEALQIAADVAQGLSALHALDIVHRDLKPANILFDATGHARVADLGLAQVPGGSLGRSQLSNPQPHPGTPGYMSPEQENSGQYLTPASDIYSLGVTLFEMLSGRLYRSLKPGTLLSKLRPDIPVQIDDLLSRLLAESYKDRPWDGEETAALLSEARNALQFQSPVEQVEDREMLEIKARIEAAGKSLEREQALRLEAERKAEQARQQAAEKARLKAEAEAAEKTLAAEQALRLETERKAEQTRQQAAEKARLKAEAEAAEKALAAEQALRLETERKASIQYHPESLTESVAELVLEKSSELCHSFVCGQNNGKDNPLPYDFTSNRLLLYSFTLVGTRQLFQ